MLTDHHALKDAFMEESNPLESQQLVQSLKEFSIEDVGSKRWMKQQQAIDKLNIQAHRDAMLNQEEYVVQAFISYQKVEILIKELIIIEIWKNRVVPLIKDELREASQNSFIPYLLLYHEAAICNLLECIFYHKDSIVYLEETILIEIVDYCQRKFNLLLHNRKLHEIEEEKVEMSDKEAFDKQLKDIEFQCCLCCLTIFRFLTDQLRELPPGIVNRILDKHDMIVTLVYIIDESPYKKKEKSGFKKYDGSKWCTVPYDEYLRVSQHEVQAWLAINNLIVDPETRNKYEYNSFRKETVSRLKKHLNDVLIDQVPVLVDLLKAVETLQVMNPPVVSKSFLIVEQVPEFRDKLLNETNFEEVAVTSMKLICEEDEEARREQIQSVAKIFGELLEMKENKEYESVLL
ncbi:hypothetical protein ABK040_011121 [Willaertia magna]